MIPIWLMTPEGFYSATVHFDDPKQVVVRSRHLADSEMLAARVSGWRRRNKVRLPGGHSAVEVVAYRGSDYPWRVIITKKEWGRFLAESAEAVNYTNFKNEVTKRQGGARHDVYLKVWTALLGLERLKGALTGHDKRAVSHPRFKGSTYLPPAASPMVGQASLLDADQIQGEGVHADCTHSACTAPLHYPACHEKGVAV